MIPSTLCCILLVLVAEEPSPATSRAAPHANTTELADEARRQRVLEAYRNVSFYQARTLYQRLEKHGRWQYAQKADFHLAFDRARGRLMIDKPDVLIVLDEKKLRMRSDQIKGRHLEIDAPRPLTYASLVKALPLVGQPELPDLMFLLDKDPHRRESEIAVKALVPDPNDPDQRPRLQFVSQRYNLLLHLEPDTFLISLAQLGLNPALLGRPKTDAVHFVNRIKIETHNTAMNDDLFSFNVTGSTPVASLEELTRHHRLIGQLAPPFELPQLNGDPVTLSAVRTRVTLIHFWATWFPGHGRELEQLQRLKRWANDSSERITVLTVNLKEKRERVRAEARKLKVTLPVLLAPGDAVATAYDANQLPRTVLVVDGRVAAVLDALDTNEDVMKSRLSRVLAQLKASQTEDNGAAEE